MSVSRRKTELVQKLKKLQKQVVDGPAGPHLRAWCDRMVAERKNWIVVSLAQLIVRSMDGLYLLEEITRNGMTGWLKPIPPLDEWEQMYRRPCPAIQRAYDCFFNVPQDLCDLIGVPEEMGPVGCGTAVRVSQIVVRRLKREDHEEWNREFKEQLRTPEGLAAICEGQHLAHKTYEGLLFNPVAPEVEDAVIDERLEQSSVQFFLLVWLPCWLEYGESASQLLAKAEMGDVPALERLLRIDKRILYFPRIRQLSEEWIRNRNEGAFALTAEAYAGMPKPQLKLDRLKVAMSTFVVHMSRAISAIEVRLVGPALTKRDMFEAFNAAAHDRGLKRDVTLPIDEEAFGKRIDREKRFRTAAAWDIFSA